MPLRQQWTASYDAEYGEWDDTETWTGHPVATVVAAAPPEHKYASMSDGGYDGPTVPLSSAKADADPIPTSFFADGGGSGGGPDYTGVVDTIPGNTSTPFTLAVGANVTGFINPVGDQDWYRITLNAGQTYTFVLAGAGASWLHDPLVRLFNSSGNWVAENDDFYTSSPDRLIFSRLTYTPSVSGTYYVSAGGFADEVGQYRLSAVLGTGLPTYNAWEVAEHLRYGYWDWQWETGGTGNPRQFATTTITYDISGLDAAGQNLAVLAMAAWHDVCGLTFVAGGPGSRITFDDNQSGAFSNSVVSGTTITSSNVNVSTAWLASNGTGIDSYSFQTYVHEIGHAIGLGHGGPYNGDATWNFHNFYATDSWSYTIMSYMDQQQSALGSYRYIMTPQMSDIIAVQDMYGAAVSRSGNTVYGHNSNAGTIYSFAAYATAPAFTIYDWGGNDILDCSGYGFTQTINLNWGAFSSIGGLTNNIGIAVNTFIENAIGGSGVDTIYGTAGDNSLVGNGSGDTLWGFDGNDWLNGGVGNDTLNGGNGWDTAIYSISSTTASWVRNDVSGTWTVNAGTNGTDTTYQVDVLRFTDRDVWLQTFASDYSGEGRSDILMRNSSGLIWEYQMNGTAISGQGAVTTPGLDWRIEGVGDFNGDGRSDVVLRNINTNQLWEYQLNGTAIIGSGGVTTLGAGWSVAGTGDFNGDGRSDILLRNSSSGLLYEYQMNGNAIIGQGLVAGPGTSWQVAGTGDFNGDGRSDILLRNSSTGQLWEYRMNGTTVTGQGSIATPGADWVVEAVGDFGGDGRADVILRNYLTGVVWEYQLSGNAIIGSGAVATLSAGWWVEGAGDFNGDGRSDLLLHNAFNGMLWEYQLNGTTITGSGLVATVGSEWQTFL